MLTSEDVIHSFFVPDFRVHMDVLPGRYTIGLVPADPKPGTITCSALNIAAPTTAGMIGTVIVMEPADYAATGCISTPRARWPWKAARSFSSIAASAATAPTRTPAPRFWKTSIGQPVHLSDGRTVVADDEYIRKSISTRATDRRSAGSNIMPTFKGQVSEEEINRTDRLI